MSVGLSSKFNILEASIPQVASAAAAYKPSRYNHFVERNGTVWGMNFLSGAFVRIAADKYSKVLRVLDGERGGGLEGTRRNLIRQRFLVPQHFNEMDLLKTKNRITRFGNHGLTMIVAPTLRCNFGCGYCYVDLNANKMKPEARLRVARFFDRKLPKNKPAEIVWTGGDPSLAMDVVEELSLSFLEACERKNSSYKASLITNGYLLHDQMRERLRRSQVTSLQISIDGSREFHDASRCLPNGKPTYDRCMENVEATCDEFRIFLRINVDLKNRAAIPDLLDDLEKRGLKDRLLIYFAHVDDVNANSSGYHDFCLTVPEYAKVEAALIRDAVTRGFKIGGRIYTKPAATFCGANSSNYFVVDSKASLLKCYLDFGQADTEGIGHIAEDGHEVVTNQYNLIKWLGWDPFESTECRDCKVLPICMGGCSHNIVNSGMQVEAGCLKLRFSMDEIVSLYGESRTGSLQQAPGCSGCAAVANV